MSELVTLIILIFSAMVHEVSHGLVAEMCGDDTARDQGRITLNPLVHIDPVSSILLPLTLLFLHSPVIFGAAKPVPVNFNNLRNPKRDMALVSLAGPLSNFALAILFVIPIKLGLVNSISGPILLQAVLVNLVLGTFNLIPIPPLDGSKVVASFLSDWLMYRILALERYGFFIILIFLMSGLLDVVLFPVVALFSRLTGVPLGF